jgi:hypothetical protein
MTMVILIFFACVGDSFVPISRYVCTRHGFNVNSMDLAQEIEPLSTNSQLGGLNVENVRYGR